MATTKMRATKYPMKRNDVSKKDKKGAVSRLLGYVFKYYPIQFVVVLIGVLIISSANTGSSYLLGTVLIDDVINPALKAVTDANGNLIAGMNAIDYLDHTAFAYTMIGMASVAVLGIVFSYFYNYVMALIAQGIQKKIRDELYSHMQKLPVSYFDTKTHGDIMSVYTNDVDSLREMLARALPMAASSFTTMVVCLIMMLITDLLLTGIVFVFAILIFFLSRYFIKMSSKYFIDMQIELGKTNGYIEEMTTGQKVIKVFNYEEKNIEGFDKHNEKLCSDSTKANRFSNIMMPTVNQLGNLQYVLIALVGGILIVSGMTSYSLTGTHVYTIGAIISFLLFSKSFVQPIGQISQQVNVIAMALAGASRIFGMMDVQEEKDEGYVELVNAVEDENGNPKETAERTGRWAWKHPHADGSGTTYTWMKGKINLYDVDFSYIKGKQVLTDITIYAKPGQKVAFVGPTGAGKTTITNLLNRFYDIEDGKIRYDDININKIKKTDLRRSLGMVLQDTKLFTGTVKENIRFGKLDATDEEVVKAAKLANADSFISLLPNGYDTVLANSGENLSQGQRQLLAIARAAVSDPPVMILDEATSSIDSRTEALVQAGMDAIMKGRTVFVIAHRLSTIKNADVIMVLDHGQIIERGNHEQLLALKGKYYQLYTGKTLTSVE
ncbi:MAG: ABC transporter ATP-binding protein [Bacilli bacterium]